MRAYVQAAIWIWRSNLRPAAGPFAIFTGALAAVGAAVLASQAHGRAPTTVDEMAQLLHAAAIAGGSLTLPTGEAAAALVVQNLSLIHI